MNRFQGRVAIGYYQKVYLILAALLFPLFDASAQEGADFTPLAPLPGIGGGGNSVGLSTYFEQMFVLLLSLITVFAVLMIVINGLKYMSTDAVSGKKEGKEGIQNALFGLLLAIAAWLILYTINPAILNVSLTPAQGSVTTGSTPSLSISNVVFNDIHENEVYKRDISPGIVFSDSESGYSAHVSSGGVPPGLSLRQGSEGVWLEGTASTAGVYNFTITIEDLEGETHAISESVEVLTAPQYQYSNKGLNEWNNSFMPALGGAVYRVIAHEGWTYDTEYVYGPYNTVQECQDFFYNHRNDMILRMLGKGISTSEMNFEGCVTITP